MINSSFIIKKHNVYLTEFFFKSTTLFELSYTSWHKSITMVTLFFLPFVVTCLFVYIRLNDLVHRLWGPSMLVEPSILL